MQSNGPSAVEHVIRLMWRVCQCRRNASGIFLLQLLHRSGRPFFLSQLLQPEAEESGELLAIPDHSLYQ